MLPAHIIEELLERERHREQAEQHQPVAELPIPEPPRSGPAADDEPERGVTIIPLW